MSSVTDRNKHAYNHGRTSTKETIPYTYLITNKTTGLKYYGSRYCSDCSPSDLWVKYFTSSKVIHALMDMYGYDDFVCEIRKIFTNKTDTIKHENTVIRRLALFKHPNYVNRCGSDGFKNVADKGTTILISNEILNKSVRWPIEKPIPDQWRRGSLSKGRENQNKNRIWIHDILTEETKMVAKDTKLEDN